MDLRSLIKRVQEHLGLTADGVAGALTWGAICDALGIEKPEAQLPAVPAVVDEELLSSIDPRSADTIRTLNPKVQPVAVQFIHALHKRGWSFKATSGNRTAQEQDRLYEIGRTRPDDDGKWHVVTNARAGHSNHNFGLALDITLFTTLEPGGSPIWESDLYDQAAEVGKDLGLLWGGDWQSNDKPHFEFRPDWARDMTERQALAEYRERVANGQAIV